jgi:aryl-alcohol dehydrogenase-like predicted oxidoreductase
VIAAELSATPAQVALAWLLAQVTISCRSHAATTSLVPQARRLARLSAIRPPTGDHYANMSPLNG